jgi:hypothetical protein
MQEKDTHAAKPLKVAEKKDSLARRDARIEPKSCAVGKLKLKCHGQMQ